MSEEDPINIDELKEIKNMVNSLEEKYNGLDERIKSQESAFERLEMTNSEIINILERLSIQIDEATPASAPASISAIRERAMRDESRPRRGLFSRIRRGLGGTGRKKSEKRKTRKIEGRQ